MRTVAKLINANITEMRRSRYRPGARLTFNGLRQSQVRVHAAINCVSPECDNQATSMPRRGKIALATAVRG